LRKGGVRLSKEGWQRRGARQGELEKKMTFFVFVDIELLSV